MSTEQPPADHGSDRYDYIEIVTPEGWGTPPLPDWLTADFMPCMDCRANLFLEWKGSRDEGQWVAVTAHDDGCPALARFEGGST